MSKATPTLSNANPRLLALVRETVLSPLLDAFADTIDGLRDPLLQQANRLELDHAPFLDGLFQLRHQRAPMLASYRAHLIRAWQALESGTRVSADLAVEFATANLDLVKHEELELQLAIHHLAEVLAREWKIELAALNNYLNWVDPALRMDADTNPFSPAQISVAVYHGFSQSKLAPQVRLAAIRCCERDLVELVGPIYEAVQVCLMREFGVPDKLSARSRPGSQIPSSETEEDPEEPDWITRFFLEWNDGAAPADAKAKPAAAAPAKAVDSSLPPALHQLLEESRLAREALAGTVAPPSAKRTTLSQRELLSIVTLLQIAPDQTIAMLVHPPGALLERLKYEMFQTAKLLGVEPGAVKLAEADENIIDLIGMLFQVMFDECDLTRGQRQVLARLIAPMTKVALQDRQLFLQSTHPARRLLNILAEACEGNRGETEEELALLHKVEATVKRLVLEFNESQSVFRTLRGDFNVYYGLYRRAAELAERETAELQRLEDALEKAKLTARATLDARLEGRALPLPVKYLLQADWVPYAAGLEVNGKPQAALAQIDGLLQALDSARRGHRDASGAWEAVVDWLQPVWMASGKDRAEIARLRSTMLEALRHMARNPVSLVPDSAQPEADRLETVFPPPSAPSVIGPLTAEELQAAVDFDNVTAEYFSALKVGTWLDFIDRDNRAQAGKLSWVSPISSRLLFVNRAGVRICVASPEELAIMVKLNRLRLHRDDDAFYSAMQGVIDRLEPAAA